MVIPIGLNWKLIVILKRVLLLHADVECHELGGMVVCGTWHVVDRIRKWADQHRCLRDTTLADDADAAAATAGWLYESSGE